MLPKNYEDYPHRRYNPLIKEWIQVSPHRTKRPWQGKVEKRADLIRSSYDKECYLCPGNKRASGEVNPNYNDTHYFTNDFSALLPESGISETENDALIKAEAVKGTSEVICFSPRHDLSLPDMEKSAIKKVIELWIYRTSELGKKYQWVQIFENKGDIMGCSNPHPHGQIWALDKLPTEPLKEDSAQLEYYNKNNIPLLLDYMDREKNEKERIVTENENWIVIVPFWAVWPFETILLPKRHIKQITGLTEDEKESLAEILKIFLSKYDRIFNVTFPYSMGWHGAPFNGKNNNHWQLHAHFYPPLLRSATVKKFMVGYEMLSESQRDITAEQAAAKLRSI